jgi:hypothetical protein
MHQNRFRQKYCAHLIKGQNLSQSGMSIDSFSGIRGPWRQYNYRVPYFMALQTKLK